MSSSLFYYLLIFVCAYGVGSLPMGYWVARLQGVADIRNHGSGNIGATNVARVLGLKYFFLIFALDAGKAYCYLKAVAYCASGSAIVLMLAALFLLLGNIYSFFLAGSGGKGVATFTGSLCATMPMVGISFMLIWALGVAVMRTVGIASVVSVAATPLIAWFLGYPFSSVAVLMAMAGLVVARHKDNIQQFINRSAA